MVRFDVRRRAYYTLVPGWNARAENSSACIHNVGRQGYQADLLPFRTLWWASINACCGSKYASIYVDSADEPASKHQGQIIFHIYSMQGIGNPFVLALLWGFNIQIELSLYESLLPASYRASFNPTHAPRFRPLRTTIVPNPKYMVLF